MQHLDGCLGAKVDMFTQVDFREPTFPDQTHKLVVTKALPYHVRYFSIFLRLALDLCLMLNRLSNIDQLRYLRLRSSHPQPASGAESSTRIHQRSAIRTRHLV